MSSNYLRPPATGLRRPTDPKKSNAMMENPPRFLEFGGLDKGAKTAVNANGVGRPNVYAIVKPGKGR